jgi:hypothetical protein
MLSNMRRASTVMSHATRLPTIRNRGLHDVALVGMIATGAPFVAAAAFVSARYKVCNPHEILVRTGLGIPDLQVSKKGMQWPFQESAKIDMAPQTYAFNLHNMSAEKVPPAWPC